MPDEMVIRHCAPTLASLKTGNMFTCAFETVEELYSSIRSLNRRLCKKGLRVIPLRFCKGRCLVYVYRPGKLREDLSNEKAGQILQACGYPCQDCAGCLRMLMERLRETGEFPHEIGLFLGYPPEDVEGFMYRKDEAKCCGCWKVYGNVDEAQKTFARFQKCTDVYVRQHANGQNIEKLTVAV